MIDLWCNGNTPGFGPGIQGSSPCRSTLKDFSELIFEKSFSFLLIHSILNTAIELAFKIEFLSMLLFYSSLDIILEIVLLILLFLESDKTRPIILKRALACMPRWIRLFRLI